MSKAAQAVAGYGLPGACLFPDRPLDPTEWGTFLAEARAERIEGLLAAAVQEGAFPVEERQLESVRQLARARCQVVVNIEREMLRASSCLTSANVSHRILKGPAFAHFFYSDPSWRAYGDVDLLVEGNDWYRAVGVLEQGGSQRLLPEIRPGFDERFGKEATLVTPGGTELDLHRTFVVGPYGFWIDLAGLLARPSRSISIASQSLPVLDPEAAFVHACYGAALADDPPRLVALRDVAQIAFSGLAVVEGVQEVAQGWRGLGVVKRALVLTQRWLGLDLRMTTVGQVLESPHISIVDRTLMWTYRGPGRGYTSQLAGVVAIRGVRAKAQYLSCLAKPQPDYLRARGWSNGSYARHVARRLAGRA